MTFEELNLGYHPPEGATFNGTAWVMPSGDLAPGQVTQGMHDSGDDTRVQWDEQGRPFSISHGRRQFTSPYAFQYSHDPREHAFFESHQQPGQSFAHNRGEWNPETGEWDQSTNWGLIGSAAAGGLIAAPFIAGAVGGASAGGAGGASTLGPTTAGSMAATDAAVAGSTVPAALGSGAALGGEAAAGGVLASHAIAPTAGTLPAGAASGAVPSALAGTAATAGTMTTAQKIAEMLRAGGQGVGAATQGASENRRADDDFGLALAREQDARSQELDRRSSEEQKQRRQAMADAYRASWYGTRQAGPFNPRPLQQMTPEFMATLNGVGTQGRTTLASPARYGVAGLPEPPALPTGPTPPSTMEQVGTWLSPTLSTIGTIARYL